MKKNFLTAIHSVLLSLFASLSVFASEPEQAETVNFNLNKIADGVYIHQGVHVGFEHPQNDDIANLGVIEGDNCLAVIDTGGSVKIAQQFKQAISLLSEKPVCYVINTHIHFDHVLGNPVFKQDAVKFAGHVELLPAMEGNRDFFKTEFKEELGKYLDTQPVVLPDILVETERELDLGNRVIRLTAHKTAHSHTDLMVLDINTNTLFTGDLLFIERIPALDGSIKGWIKQTNELLSANYSHIVPGHGPVIEDNEAIKLQAAYLNALQDETRVAINEGMFMEEAVDEIGKTTKTNWLLHEQHHRRNVTRTFSELEWE